MPLSCSNSWEDRFASLVTGSFLLLLAQVIPISMAHAQSAFIVAKDAVQDRLVGNGDVEWVEERWRQVMGGGGCEDGKSYYFLGDGSGRLEECIDGQVTKTDLNWTLSKQGEAVIMKLGETSYDIRMKEDSGVLLLRLTELLEPGPETDFKTEDVRIKDLIAIVE